LTDGIHLDLDESAIISSIEIKLQLLFDFLASCPPKKSCSTDKKAAKNKNIP
jgi:hypothetical protein